MVPLNLRGGKGGRKSVVSLEKRRGGQWRDTIKAKGW